MSFLSNILPKSQNKEYFLTIGVQEHKIIATVAVISRKEINIIGSGISEFANGSEETEAADIAISKAEEKIGENVLVQKVIFGLPVSFLDGDEIRPQHLQRLKKITKTLSLIPCGFVEYPQALSYYLQTKEESPPTLLLLSIGSKQITFSHIRVGKIENNFLADKTASITSDFEKAIINFASAEILPSRIMLYDESGSEDLDKLKEELLRFSWHKHSVFLHTPKIETFETQDLSYALVESTARSFTKELHFEEKSLPELKQTEEPDKKEETVEEDFGFVKSGYTAPKQTQEENTEEKQETRVSFISKLPKINFSFPRLNFIPAPVFIITASIVFLLIAVVSLLWYYPSAAVNLIVYPRLSVSNLDIIVTTNNDTAKSVKNSILASNSTIDVAGDKTAPATGQTKIGERSTGSLTIYNKTLSAKMFPKGTILTADVLKFTLDSDTTVASASDTGEGLTFGKTAAKITAFDIGPDSNLSSGTNFYFQSFDKSSYYAKNADKLSGGSSREITSVSKDDQDKLLSALTETLLSQAKQEITSKLNPGERLLDTLLTYDIKTKKFAHNIGEESKEEKLSLSLAVSTLIYKDDDLLRLARDNTSPIPPGFSLASDKTNIKISQTSTDKKGDVVGKAAVTYYFFPEIDLSKIRKDISGKTYSQTEEYFSKITEIGGFEIIPYQKLPFWNNILPMQSNNIKLKLVAL